MPRPIYTRSRRHRRQSGGAGLFLVTVVLLLMLVALFGAACQSSKLPDRPVTDLETLPWCPGEDGPGRDGLTGALGPVPCVWGPGNPSQVTVTPSGFTPPPGPRFAWVVYLADDGCATLRTVQEPATVRCLNRSSWDG